MSRKVGIVYSPGFGAGWSTWGDAEQALDQDLAHALERRASADELTVIAEKNWPDAYLGGISDLAVQWVDEGTLFEIHEYDGNESIVFHADPGWLIATVKEQQP